MARRLLGPLAAAALGGALVVAAATASVAAPRPAAPNPQASHRAVPQAQASHWAAPQPQGSRWAAPTAPKVTVDFTGIVALSNCSGSLVRVPGAADSDPALVLTNGHCNENGMPSAGQVVLDKPSSRTFGLLDSTGQKKLGTLQAAKILYGTMTDTDITLYQLNTTYANIQQTYHTPALAISTDHPTQGADIRVVSGYWKKIYSCKIDAFVYRLREDQWTMKDSIRYTSPCDIIGGTSGSPVIDTATGKIVGINNTLNENGEQCTFDNPCEVDQNGKITVHKGIGYAQETYLLPGCMGPGSTIDLNKSGCQLPKPAAAAVGAPA